MNINSFNKVLYKEVGTFTAINELSYESHKLCTAFSTGKIYKHKIKRQYMISIDHSKYKDIPMEKTSLVGNCVFQTNDKVLASYNDKLENWVYDLEITREYKKSILEGLTFLNEIIDKMYQIDYVQMQNVNYRKGLYQTKYYHQMEDNANQRMPLFLNAVLVDIYNRYNKTLCTSIDEVFSDKNFWNVIRSLNELEEVPLGKKLKLEASDHIYKDYPWYSILKDMILPKVTIKLLNESEEN
ncbi:hypothetical protein IZY60_03955 [Lutibacter sp. B2]|nr:hypothetical protein [Lutibacter sp. B2]